MIRKCFLYVSLLVLPCYAYSTDYYVRSGGSDTWPCGSTASPCGKISTVIDHVTGDANVRVAQGAYNDQINIFPVKFNSVHIGGGWNAAFTEKSCNPKLTVLQPSNDYSSVVKVNQGASQSIDVDLSCLTFKGVSDTHRQGIALQAISGSLTFSMSQSIIDGFAGQGMSLYSNSAGVIDMVVDKTIFKNSYQPVGQSPWPGGGIYAAAYGSSHQTISLQNSIMHGNQAHGGAAIDFGANNAGSSINALLLNSTISDNYSPGVAATSSGGLRVLAIDSGQAEVNIQNTILWGNSNTAGSRDISINEVSTGVATVDSGYSVVGEVFILNGHGTYNDNGNNMNIEPKLNSTYHLNSASPAIDVAQCGDNTTPGYHRIAPYDDIDGDLRPGYGAILGCDIGADEFTQHRCFPYTPNGKIQMLCW